MPRTEIPDSPSPKDVALLVMLEWLTSDSVAPTAEMCEDIIRERGWVQYSCTPKKMEKIQEQFDALVQRLLKTVETPLKSRCIL